MTKPKAISFACEHANEVPNICPCPSTCYCKKHTCKPGKMTKVKRPKMSKLTDRDAWLEFRREHITRHFTTSDSVYSAIVRLCQEAFEAGIKQGENAPEYEG